MIPLVKPYMPPREVLMPALEQILYSGYIATGQAVDDFEMEFRRFIGNPNMLSLHSGTDALHLAFILAGVKPGDEVISTPMTAEPTNTSIAMVGAKIGTVGTFKNDGDVPIFERYFLGGSDSLRGFEYRTVAPAIGKDDQIGGQTMLLLTAEVTHPIWGPLRGAAFVDVGNAWRDSYEMDFSDLNVGVGYGLRIRLPVVNAPIRLDLAYPVVNNLKYVDSKLRLHFNVGFTF